MTFVRILIVTPNGHEELAILRTTTQFEVVFQHLLTVWEFVPEVQDLHGMRFRYLSWPVFGHQTPEDFGFEPWTEIVLNFPYDPIRPRN